VLGVSVATAAVARMEGALEPEAGGEVPS
jgi:hypothetical protein